MAINPTDLEAIKQAIIGAINSAAGTAGTGATVGNPDEISRLEKYVETLNRANTALERQQARAEKMSDATERQNELDRITIEQQQNLIDRRRNELALDEQRGVVAGHIAAQRRIEIDDAYELIETTREAMANRAEDTKSREKNKQAIEKQTEAMNKLSGSIGGVIAQHGKHATFNIASVSAMSKTVAEAGIFGSALGMLKGIMGGLIDTTISLMFKVDDAQSAFMATTGASRDMAHAIEADVQEMQRLGVAADKLYGAHTTLRKEMTSFTMLQPDAQRELAKTGAALEKQGVSMTDFAKTNEIAIRALGMTATEAGSVSIQLNNFAQQIGVAPDQIAAGFAKAGDQLAVFGTGAVDTFQDLVISSKKTGLEIDKLIRISDGFDTFEGAATQAGKLNAALGGNFVNAMDLMMAKEPAKRFEMIRDAVMKTGKTFDEMDYFEKKFYVNSIDGIDSVADLAMLMSDNFEELGAESNKTSKDFASLAERTKAIQSITEAFQSTLASLAPVLTKDVIPKLKNWIELAAEGKGPIGALTKGIQLFAKGLEIAAEWTKTTLFVLGLLFFGPTLLRGAAMFGKLTTLTRLFGITAIESGTAAGTGLASGITTVGAAATGAAKGLLALGGAVALVGLGIGLAAAGIGQLVAAFGQVGDNAPAAVFGILAFGAAMAGMMFVFAKMAPVALGASGSLMAFGGAIALVGLGVGLVAAGIGYMAEGFSALFASLTPENTKNFTTFVDDIATNAEGLAIGAAGLLLMSYAVSQLASSLSELPTEDLDKLSKLGGIDVGVVFDGAVENVKAMMDSINSVDTIKLAATSLIVTSAMAGNAAAAQPPAQMATQNQKDTNVDVKVYLGTEQLDARVETLVNNRIVRASQGR